MVSIKTSYPPYTNFSRGRCLIFIGTEGLVTEMKEISTTVIKESNHRKVLSFKITNGSNQLT